MKKRILAIIICVITLVGWYITVFGIGSMDSVKDKLKLGLDIEGGVYVVMEAQTNEKGDELKTTMEQTQAVIENRVNQMGLSEANVTIEGDKRIRVELPGVEDTDEAIEQIGRTAQLTFLLSDGTEVLTGTDVKNASINKDSDNGGYLIELDFSNQGAKKFEKGTITASSRTVTPTMSYEDGTKMDPSSIVIMLDKDVVSAPTCDKPISGTSCVITRPGGFEKEEATNLAALIRGGALPTPLQEIESSVQSASIGYDAFDKSIVAGAIGLALVFILMLLMYNVLGLVADIALMLYVILVIWIMVGMGSVLTLPGIAGIILSIGMAVDANVIIFSRIKEEIAAGRTVRVAVSSGFKRALTTVLDAQITTLIAAVVLYEIGTATVKGFAMTLMIGIIVSIFTAVVVSNLFTSLIADSKKFGKYKYFGCNEDGTPKQFINKEFKFIEKRKIFYSISAVVVIIGLVFALFKGFNSGIDFTGGTMLQIDTHKQVAIEEVEKALDKYDLDATIVYGGNDNDQIIIKTTKALDNAARMEVVGSLDSFGVTDDDLLAANEFGPSVGKELKQNAVKALLIAALGMLIYIIFRFKSWKYGVASVGGVLHDVLILLACYAIFGITVNNPFIAGILTVVGYSINDTIVIFDRVRENKANNRSKEPNDILMNRSVNQTLNRSIMTSLTTLIVMIPLCFMVSTAISEFIIPLMIGVIAGTYSSIFICTPVVYEFFKGEDVSAYEKKQLAQGKKSKKVAR
ncbi:MAG: protein translocase subunit SecD [Clostridia bacterium]|nr:protein translocase subunit SecD [Clostridia bacterium]